MILEMWPVTTWFWLGATFLITFSYCLVIAKFGLASVPAQVQKWFVYSCGVGHTVMAGFMVLLHHNYWAFLMVTVWDWVTALASVTAAFYAWRR